MFDKIKKWLTEPLTTPVNNNVEKVDSKSDALYNICKNMKKDVEFIVVLSDIYKIEKIWSRYFVVTECDLGVINSYKNLRVFELDETVEIKHIINGLTIITDLNKRFFNDANVLTLEMLHLCMRGEYIKDSYKFDIFFKDFIQHTNEFKN